MGSIIRHSAGAITIMIGLVLAPLVIALFMFSQSLEGLREALIEYSIPNQLSVFYSNSLRVRWLGPAVDRPRRDGRRVRRCVPLLEKRDV
ncbi:hypothetical protein SALBM311S_12671 [Streptomyces alboniger]